MFLEPQGGGIESNVTKEMRKRARNNLGMGRKAKYLLYCEDFLWHGSEVGQ